MLFRVSSGENVITITRFPIHVKERDEVSKLFEILERVRPRSDISRRLLVYAINQAIRCSGEYGIEVEVEDLSDSIVIIDFGSYEHDKVLHLELTVKVAEDVQIMYTSPRKKFYVLFKVVANVTEAESGITYLDYEAKLPLIVVAGELELVNLLTSLIYTTVWLAMLRFHGYNIDIENALKKKVERYMRQYDEHARNERRELEAYRTASLILD